MEQYYDIVPKTTRCTNNLAQGTIFRNRNHAQNYKYISLHDSNNRKAIILDIDYEGLLAQDLSLYPNYIVRNKNNSKCHVVYLLKVPVHYNNNSNINIQRWFEYCCKGLSLESGADLSYNGLITKNPFHQDFRTEWCRREPYTLDEISEYILDKGKEIKTTNSIKTKRELKLLDIEKGCRNDSLFRIQANEAYKIICGFIGSYEDFYHDIYTRLSEKNLLISEPLGVKEISNIAKSISKFVYYKFSTAHKERFVSKQRERGKKSGQVRAEKAQKIKNKAFIYLCTNKPIEAIAEFLGVSIRTIYNIKAEIKNRLKNLCNEPISDRTAWGCLSEKKEKKNIIYCCRCLILPAICCYCGKLLINVSKPRGQFICPSGFAHVKPTA